MSEDTPSDPEARVAQSLLAGLDQYELDEEDRALLEGGPDLVDEAGSGPLPVLAVVGRPNVGKSTLVNRILGRREAVVEDVPGVTRDRVAYEANWAGRRFTLVDTGGWENKAHGIQIRVAEQAEIAIDLADAVLFVVDATVGRDRRGRPGRRAAAPLRQAGRAGGQQGRRPARRGRRGRAVVARAG